MVLVHTPCCTGVKIRVVIPDFAGYRGGLIKDNAVRCRRWQGGDTSRRFQDVQTYNQELS